MSEKPVVPWTPLAQRYAELRDRKGGTAARVSDAASLARNPERLVEEFEDSIKCTTRFYEDHPRQPEPFFDKPRPLNVEPGLSSTDALARLLEIDRENRPDPRWRVGGGALDFYFLEREPVVTRAPGWLLEGANGRPSRTTRDGLRVDQLLANADGGTPILGEVKIESDKDPFFGLIQILAAAPYVLPPQQMKRIAKHDPNRRADPSATRVDAYLVLSGDQSNPAWRELAESAQAIAEAVAPSISKWVRRIAAVDLSQAGSDADQPLLIRQRFAYG